MIGYIWDHLKYVSLLLLVVACVFQLRAVYIKKVLVKEYGFMFPPGFLGTVRIHELKANRSQSDSPALKKVITSFIVSKKWVYIFVLAAAFTFIGPHLFKLWVSDGKRY
ncbi:MAG: hypothetical protein JST47_14990 [Bacteroidetes bacterium]|nr:hypothetical protein [Bacteroidota bacterium]